MVRGGKPKRDRSNEQQIGLAVASRFLNLGVAEPRHSLHDGLVRSARVGKSSRRQRRHQEQSAIPTVPNMDALSQMLGQGGGVNAAPG